MKFVIIGNQARAMSNFWSVLISQAVARGHEVVAFLPDSGEWGERLRELGVRVRNYPLDRKGLNPVSDWKTLGELRKLLKEEQPDCLFAYTIKSLIYGSLAAALAGYPRRENRHVMITGLGYAFEADTFIKKTLRTVASLLYRLALMQVKTVFFQNPDDKAVFEKFNIIPKSVQVEMCRGTGVDVEHFAVKPLPGSAVLATGQDTDIGTGQATGQVANHGTGQNTNRAGTAGAPQSFLLVGRLLEAKGLREYYQAAKQVKKKHPETRFAILGPAEQGVGSVPLEEVRSWQTEGIVEYLGESADVRPFLEKASVVVLPSYREGTPCSLLEGMSMGRALLATDVPGCRETVHQGKNGLLTPLKDVNALASAMLRFIEEPGLTEKMGQNGRKLAEEQFDAQKVAAGLLKIFGL